MAQFFTRLDETVPLAHYGVHEKHTALLMNKYFFKHKTQQCIQHLEQQSFYLN